MYIDPHVHCRDGEKESYKETIRHALYVAERAGATAIFDMPNTKPAVKKTGHVIERIKLAKRTGSPVFYGTYIGATPDEAQLSEAVLCYDGFEQVVGFKMYAGKSVGDIEVVKEEDQRRVYKKLAQLGYKGVLVVHCEKQSLIDDKIWTPDTPVSHAFARPPEAEVESVNDQIKFAKEAGFEGTLHVAHISLPESVEIVKDARDKLRITCGVTPHHILFDYTRMSEEDGILYKMNPPLREPGTNTEMLQLLEEGAIDWIESDHAPHTYAEKTSDSYMSGVPWLHAYPRFLKWLERNGFSIEQLDDLTFNNIKRTFEPKLKNLRRRKVQPNMNIYNEYAFDPMQ